VRQTAVRVAQDRRGLTGFGTGQALAMRHAQILSPAKIAKRKGRRIDRDQMALLEAF